MTTNNQKGIESTIKSRIYGHNRGWCFTPKDLKGLGSETALRKALSRLEKKGFVRRLAQGLYEYPRIHETLGLLPPSVEKVAKGLRIGEKLKFKLRVLTERILLGLQSKFLGV